MNNLYPELKFAWAQDPVYIKIKAAYEESMRHEYPEVTAALVDAMIRCRLRINKKGANMKQLALGMILGSLLTGTMVGAGTFYDQHGQPNAPAGSIQQFDYFRQRQLFLDAQNLRRNQEESMRQQRLNPCAR